MKGQDRRESGKIKGKVTPNALHSPLSCAIYPRITGEKKPSQASKSVVFFCWCWCWCCSLCSLLPWAKHTSFTLLYPRVHWVLKDRWWVSKTVQISCIWRIIPLNLQYGAKGQINQALKDLVHRRFHGCCSALKAR